MLRRRSARPTPGTGDTLIATFITYPTAGIGVTALPPGISTRVFRVVCGGGNQEARLKVAMYISVAPYAPGDETLVRTDYSPTFKGSTLIDLSWNHAAASAVAMNATDRVVMRLYTARVAGPEQSPSTVYFDGTTNLSYIQTTLPSAGGYSDHARRSADQGRGEHDPAADSAPPASSCARTAPIPAGRCS